MELPGITALIPSLRQRELTTRAATPAQAVPQLSITRRVADEANPEPAMPREGAGADSVALTPAARLIGEAMAAEPSTHDEGLERSLLRPEAPLLRERADDPAALAHALQRSIVRSGLFYESHAFEWAVGRRALGTLHEEPQWTWLDAHWTAVPIATDEAATRAAERMLRRQLQVLDREAVTWEGELWPGQLAWIELARRAGRARTDPLDAGGATPIDDPGTTFVARVELVRAGIGPLAALITISRAVIECRIEAPTSDLDRVQAALPALASALSAHGLLVRTSASPRRAEGAALASAATPDSVCSDAPGTDGARELPAERCSPDMVRRMRDAGIPLHPSDVLVALLARADLDRRLPALVYTLCAHCALWACSLGDRAHGAASHRKSR